MLRRIWWCSLRWFAVCLPAFVAGGATYHVARFGWPCTSASASSSAAHTILIDGQRPDSSLIHGRYEVKIDKVVGTIVAMGYTDLPSGSRVGKIEALVPLDERKRIVYYAPVQVGRDVKLCELVFSDVPFQHERPPPSGLFAKRP